MGLISPLFVWTLNHLINGIEDIVPEQDVIEIAEFYWRKMKKRMKKSLCSQVDCFVRTFD